jgi:hypothetical protein
MGAILHPNCYDLMINQYGYNMHITFTASDIVEINPVIKYSNFIDLATGNFCLFVCLVLVDYFLPR